MQTVDCQSNKLRRSLVTEGAGTEDGPPFITLNHNSLCEVSGRGFKPGNAHPMATVAMKIYPIMVHGRQRWRLDFLTAVGRFRKVYPSYEQAFDAACHPTCRETATNPYNSNANAGFSSAKVSLEAANAQLIAAKRDGGRAKAYLHGLDRILRRFSDSLGNRPVGSVGPVEIERWLAQFSPITRNTFRARLSGLFTFALRRGWISANPIARVESAKVIPSTPRIFTVHEMRTSLDWFCEHPTALAWFSLSCLCGLRPEEAERTPWSAIDLDAGLIRVEAATSKVRQRRVVYPLPQAIAWLRHARKLGSPLPIAHYRRRSQCHKLRSVLGWSTWPADITRHTAASYWLALRPDENALANQLGHSVTTLRTHYKALVTRSDADSFWGLGIP